MTIKLNTLARWHDLPAGQQIWFGQEGEPARLVRLHVNLSHPTVFNIEDAYGPRLLCAVPAGVETIEFSAEGRFSVFPDANSGEVQFQTAELEPAFAEIADPKIFTKIANRRHRNPELEEIMYRMNLNMERRLADQAEQFEAALERRRNEEANGRPAETVVTNAPGAAANAGGAEVRPQNAAAEPEEADADAET